MEDQKFLENEKELVESAKTNDADFGVLYDFYLPKIYGYIIKRTGNRETAEDLTSQTFLKAFSNLKKYQSKGHTFGAWLYKIATNNLIDYYRKVGKKQEVSLENSYNVEDEGSSPEELAHSNQEGQLVNLVLKKLSLKYQEVLHLKFFAELETAEIAETLNITPNNSRVLIYRALKNFRKFYDQQSKRAK